MHIEDHWTFSDRLGCSGLFNFSDLVSSRGGSHRVQMMAATQRVTVQPDNTHTVTV